MGSCAIHLPTLCPPPSSLCHPPSHLCAPPHKHAPCPPPSAHTVPAPPHTVPAPPPFIPPCQAIADRQHAPVASVVLRFVLQLGVAVIPRSTNSARMRSNLALWDLSLSDTDMQALVELDGTSPV